MADINQLVIEATNKFAMDLHNSLRNSVNFASESLFYFPASLMIALGMTSLGARGNTAKELAQVLHTDAALSDDLHANMKTYLDSLNSASDGDNTLLTANRLFIQQSFEILYKFKEGTRKFYEAELGLVEYVGNVEGARQGINRWVEDKTNDKIKELIPEGMLNEDTRLTLVNAIYLRGLWLKRFHKEGTFPTPFHVSSTEQVQVPMMHQEADFKHLIAEDFSCQILELPYTGNKISMVVFLPDAVDGLADLEAKLNYDSLCKALSSLDNRRPEELEVILPKFKLTQQFKLHDILFNMGAKDLFSPGKANLSGISPEKLYVSVVVHKAFVEVNEEGTEAAAATAVGVVMYSCVLKPVFNADHPFLFLIRHSGTGVILFMGRVLNPAKAN